MQDFRVAVRHFTEMDCGQTEHVMKECRGHWWTYLTRPPKLLSSVKLSVICLCKIQLFQYLFLFHVLTTHMFLSQPSFVFNSLNTELNPIRHLLALVGARHIVRVSRIRVNPLNAELNSIRHLLALVGARHIVHVSRIRVNPMLANGYAFSAVIN